MHAEHYEIYKKEQAGVLYIYSQRPVIDTNPDYQREGGLWDLEKRQLLIDTLLNRLDLPKIYMHALPVKRNSQKVGRRFAVVDGKQRLETIWAFIDGEFRLAEDFEYFPDTTIKLGGMTYAELASAYPTIKSLFDSTALPIWVIATEEMDLIEELFSRLNEAVSLNAPEKRNAFGGPLPKAIRELEKHPFFEECVPIKNTRYKYRDLAAKFLYLTEQRELKDTKKARLDQFVKGARQWESGSLRASKLRNHAEDHLALLAGVFRNNDPLLRNVGMLTVYYGLALQRVDSGIDFPSRRALESFEKLRAENKKLAESDPESQNVDFDLLEFDRLSQSPNDGVALRFRLQILDQYSRAWPSGNNPRPVQQKL